jgi:hypothetical protein
MRGAMTPFPQGIYDIILRLIRAELSVTLTYILPEILDFDISKYDAFSR